MKDNESSIEQTLRPKKIRDRSLDPKIYRGYKFSAPKKYVGPLSCILQVPPGVLGQEAMLSQRLSPLMRINGIGEFNTWGNPAMEQYRNPGWGNRNILNATETEISSAMLGYQARMQTLPTYKITCVGNTDTIHVISRLLKCTTHPLRYVVFISKLLFKVRGGFFMLSVYQGVILLYHRVKCPSI